MPHIARHRRFPRRAAAALAAVVTAAVTAVVPVASATTAHAADQPPGWSPGRTMGTLPDGATYVVDVPPVFNGTLLLYSHGLVFPGDPNPAEDAPDPTTASALLNRGYALAGSSFGTGFAVEEALRDQTAVLDEVRRQFGAPTHTLAWGTSLGGLVTGLLVERNPGRFDGALPACGLMAGGTGVMNTYLDLMFTIKTLLAPDLVLTSDPDPFATVGLAQTTIQQAMTTPTRRARVALAAAMADMPGWAGAGSPRPDRQDFQAQVTGQAQTLQELVVFLAVLVRAELEQRAGGNVSWNTGVDYARQLERSTARTEVVRLYREADVPLTADLRRLEQATRISADPKAAQVLRDLTTLSGDLHGTPVLTLHTAGDGAVAPENEQAYEKAVDRSGSSSLLRQVFVERAGHCTFTPAELVTAVQALDSRVRTGRFPQLSPAALNRQAADLGPELNGVIDNDTGAFISVESEFSRYQPGVFLRPDRQP